jgi:hypothetical protein
VAQSGHLLWQSATCDYTHNLSSSGSISCRWSPEFKPLSRKRGGSIYTRFGSINCRKVHKQWGTPVRCARVSTNVLLTHKSAVERGHFPLPCGSQVQQASIQCSGAQHPSQGRAPSMVHVFLSHSTTATPRHHSAWGKYVIVAHSLIASRRRVGSDGHRTGRPRLARLVTSSHLALPIPWAQPTAPSTPEPRTDPHSSVSRRRLCT